MTVAAGLVELEAAGGAGSGAGGQVSAWHGAQGYHFWLLAHRQLYAGNTDAAMRTALHLRKYCPTPLAVLSPVCHECYPSICDRLTCGTWEATGCAASSAGDCKFMPMRHGVLHAIQTCCGGKIAFVPILTVPC